MNKKIRLGFLIGTLERGGAQRLILDLIKNINTQNFDPYLIFWRKGDFYKEFTEIPYLRILSIENHLGSFGVKNTLIYKFLLSIKLITNLVMIIRNEKIEILHSHLIESDILTFLLKVIKKDLKTISTKHNTSFKNKTKWIYRLLSNFINLTFNKIIFCSRNVKNSFFRYGYSKNTKIIYNGVDIVKIESFPIEHQDFIKKDFFNLISVGRLEKVKGHDNLIRVFKIFNQIIPNSQLFICGAGKEKNNLLSLINKLNLKRKVILLGVRSDIYSFIKQFDLFILLSNREGLPLSILEAIACKLVVIASDIDGVNEIILNGRNGYLVKQEKYLKIAKLIVKLRDNHDLKKGIINQAIKDLYLRFDIKKTVKEYESIYLGLF